MFTAYTCACEGSLRFTSPCWNYTPLLKRTWMSSQERILKQNNESNRALLIIHLILTSIHMSHIGRRRVFHVATVLFSSIHVHRSRNNTVKDKITQPLIQHNKDDDGDRNWCLISWNRYAGHAYGFLAINPGFAHKMTT